MIVFVSFFLFRYVKLEKPPCLSRVSPLLQDELIGRTFKVFLTENSQFGSWAEIRLVIGTALRPDIKRHRAELELQKPIKPLNEAPGGEMLNILSTETNP